MTKYVPANKPFWTFYKTGKDWKKSLKIVSLEKNLALQAQSLIWRLDLLTNEDSSFVKFEQMIHT